MNDNVLCNVKISNV